MLLLPCAVFRWTMMILILGCLSFKSALGITLDELRQNPDLTPQKFASYFADFRFKFLRDIQPPEKFLASKIGDCDDYAILAAQVLEEKGYHPRLIAIRMPRVVHVVCYFPEVNGFLDYNARRSKTGIIRSGPELHHIAGKVAGYYKETWTSASEFTFESGAKRLVATVTPTDGSRATAQPAESSSKPQMPTS